MLTRLILALAITLIAPSAFAALDIDQRLACQASVEDAKWADRIWPEGSPQAKPSRASVVPDALIASRVERQLRMETALRERFAVVIDAATLQEEIDRMARYTRAPKQLQRWFAALGNDPQRVAECIALPYLVEQALRHAHATSETGLEFDAWWASVESRFAVTVNERESKGLMLPAIAQAANKNFSPDTWRGEGVPSARSGHVAVWTGTEMVVWSGKQSPFDTNTVTNTGGRYTPATDTWIGVSVTGAPAERYLATGIWTGTDMLVFGGRDGSDNAIATGGRYDPATDTWTSITQAPVATAGYAHAWSGTDLYIFGGSDGFGAVNTGNRYNAATNSWTPITTISAPSARVLAKGAWTGDRFLVWGGDSLTDGALYDPSLNSWSPMNSVNAPSVDAVATSSLWIGDSFLVVGGFTSDPGRRYDPVGNAWTTIAALPIAGQLAFSPGAWTGDSAVFWGGIIDGVQTDEGFIYDPVANDWATLPALDAPAARIDHTLINADGEVIAWGGQTDTSTLRSGARFDLMAETWSATADQGDVPLAATGHAAVWTGVEMLVLGGTTAPFQSVRSRYEPAIDQWSSISTTTALNNRTGATVTWTGTEAIVWGGIVGFSASNAGARYNPSSDSWADTSLTNAPSPRTTHSATWTGTELIVFGGSDGGNTNLSDGARYDPATNDWTAITDAPAARAAHGAAWLGDRLFVCGGNQSASSSCALYDTALNAWAPVDAPAGLLEASGIYQLFNTGDEVLAVGQLFGSPRGARYVPTSGAWYPIDLANAPLMRVRSSSAWTGDELIIWGGMDQNTFIDQNTGARYSPVRGTWQTTPLPNAPTARNAHTAVWTGDDVIVWGGSDEFGAPVSGLSFYRPPAIGTDPSTTSIVAPTPATVGAGETYTVTVAVNGTAPNGTVLVEDDAGQDCRVILPQTGCDLVAAAAGTRNLRARYSGDASNAKSSGTASVLVSKAQPTLDITGITPPAGQLPTVSYQVTVALDGPAPFTGVVVVSDGDGASCQITAGVQTSCSLASATEGQKTITATYAGDDFNESASDTTTYQIARAQPALSIVQISPAGSQMVGQNYVVQISITSPAAVTGLVTIDDGEGASCQINTQTSSGCVMNSSIPGNLTISANYPGDTQNAPASDTEPYVISDASLPTSVGSLSSQPNPSRLGQAVTFTASVFALPAPTAGSVTFTAAGGETCTDNTPITGAANRADYSCSITFNTLGTRTYSTSYSGAPGYDPSTNPTGSHRVARFSDIEVVADTGLTSIEPGDAVQNALLITNNGPDSAPGLDVQSGFNQPLIGWSWACMPPNQAACNPQQGFANIDTVVTLPASGSVVIEITGTLPESATQDLVLFGSAFVDPLPPNHGHDPNPTNNIDSVTSQLTTIFGNGFED